MLIKKKKIERERERFIAGLRGQEERGKKKRGTKATEKRTGKFDCSNNYFVNIAKRNVHNYMELVNCSSKLYFPFTPLLIQKSFL